MIPALEAHCGSWVVSRKDTGEVVGEFWERRTVERFSADKVNIETAAQYLNRLNREIQSGVRPGKSHQ